MNPLPCISIDLGSSYTKIAIRDRWNRRTESGPAQLVRSTALHSDESNISIPTLAAYRQTSTGGEWLFGADVANRRPDSSSRITVYRNWKRALFGDHHPFDGGNQPRRIPNGTEIPKSVLQTILDGYFAYLLQFVERSSKVHVEDCRVRVAIPDFALRTPGERMMRQAMENAGWPTRRSVDFVSEPHANVIGVLTEGENAIVRGDYSAETCPDLLSMLRPCPLQKAAANPDFAKRRDPHWVFVADLGAYTLDFALLGFNPGNLQHDLDERVQGKARFRICSEPIGISYLTDQISEILSPEGRAYLQLLQREQGDTMFFDRILGGSYLEDPATFVTIGEGIEGERIRQIIAAFARDVAHRVQSFLAAHGPSRIDESILTGGGMNVNPVRDAVLSLLDQRGSAYAFVPMKALEQLPSGRERLPQDLVRGATALGGGSVHFDFLAVPEYS
jgi:hypothetical protein